MTPESHRIINFLAGMPSGNSTITKEQLKEILLSTGGWMMACGRMYDIESKHLGAGIYKIFLKER